MSSYQEINRANWDERVPAHLASQTGYHVDELVADPAFISSVVRFDQPHLGDVRGLRAVHLQCHIGTDTVSLARLGAVMTGLDFSAPAVAAARALAARAGVAAEFVQAELYDAVGALGAGRFDLVYTGIGALCWLPDIRGWARVVAGLLAPGGRLFLRDAHPVLGTLADPRPDGLLAVEFPYFEQAQPMVFEDPGTYVETDVVLTQTRTWQWNHGLGEIVTALLGAGMTLTALTEHDSAPWPALGGQMVPAGPEGEWRLADRPERLAATFTLQARKNR